MLVQKIIRYPLVLLVQYRVTVQGQSDSVLSEIIKFADLFTRFARKLDEEREHDGVPSVDVSRAEVYYNDIVHTRWLQFRRVVFRSNVQVGQPFLRRIASRVKERLITSACVS